MQWRLKSQASRLFTQPFVQGQIKENIKALRHWPLWGKFTGDLLIPRTKCQWRGKCFPLMTSSWMIRQLSSESRICVSIMLCELLRKSTNFEAVYTAWEHSYFCGSRHLFLGLAPNTRSSWYFLLFFRLQITHGFYVGHATGKVCTITITAVWYNKKSL